MAVIGWEPLAELSTIQNEMNRLFDTFFDGGTPVNGGARRWIPAMDLLESDDELVLRADLPGVSQSDVSIELEGNVLTVSGERKTEHEARREGYYRLERASGTFARSLTVPEGVDPDSVTASFDRGVLEVRVPKPEEHKRRKVAITVGTGQPQEIETASGGTEN